MCEHGQVVSVLYLGRGRRKTHQGTSWYGALELAGRIAHGPTVAHSLTKYLVQQSMGLSFREALELASAAQEHVRQTEDHKIAVQWFLDKNRGMPPFVGR